MEYNCAKTTKRKEDSPIWKLRKYFHEHLVHKKKRSTDSPLSSTSDHQVAHSPKSSSKKHNVGQLFNKIKRSNFTPVLTKRNKCYKINNNSNKSNNSNDKNIEATSGENSEVNQPKMVSFNSDLDIYSITISLQSESPQSIKYVNCSARDVFPMETEDRFSTEDCEVDMSQYSCYTCFYCNNPLFLLNDRIGCYNLVNLTFSRPIFENEECVIEFVQSHEDGLKSAVFRCAQCNRMIGHLMDSFTQKPISTFTRFNLELDLMFSDDSHVYCAHKSMIRFLKGFPRRCSNMI